MVQYLKGALTWLGGSVAALTVLCYGAGYLLFHDHLIMLGLNGVVDLPPDLMLLEGSRFFLVIGSTLVLDSLIVIVFAAAALALYVALTRIGAVARGLRAVAGRVAALPAGLVELGVLIAFLAFVIWHFDTFYDPAQGLGDISQRLFGPLAQQSCAAIAPGLGTLSAAQVGALIGKGSQCRDELYFQFYLILSGYFVLLALVWLVSSAWGRRLASGGAGTIVRVMLGGYALIYTLSLPLAFGVLVRAPLYPDVVMTLADNSIIAGRLVEHNDHVAIVWASESRQALWYPNQNVRAIRVVGVSNLFDPGKGIRP